MGKPKSVSPTRAPGLALAIKSPDEMREALVRNAAEDWVAGIVKGIRGEPPFDKPQRWAFRLVAEVAKLVGMPQGHMLAIIQREVGVDLPTARLAVDVWHDSQSLSDEAKAEVAEDFLARRYGLPVGILRDALQRAQGARVGDNGGGQGS